MEMRKLTVILSALVWFGLSYSTELVQKESRFSGEETVKRIVETVKRKGLKVFTIVDHKRAAEEYGLDMPFEKVVIFGNPRVGTKFMLEDPRVGVELPLRILVYERKGRVYMVYKDPLSIEKDYKLKKFHRFFLKLSENLDKLTDRLAR